MKKREKTEMLFSILRILLTSYVILSLILFIFQRKLLYLAQEGTNNVDAEEIDFTNGDTILRGWVVNKGKEKAIIYYGGNAEVIEENIDYFREILPEFTLYLINYRGYGESDGKPTEENLYNDA
ncbi:MAG: hypothetical protein L6407_05410 [Candidatus Delongbacteria bacterium]|nr:hypothetical protein [Candidatus Delongbacteria bacterium]